MSHPPTSLGGKRSPGFQPHRQACHLTISGSEEEPPSDQYLLSVFTVFSFKKQQQKDGEKNHSKEQKEKKPSIKPTMDFVSFIFFLFFFSCFLSFFFFSFFFFANGKKMGCFQHRGFLSLCVSHCPQPSGCQMLPRHGATGARRHGPAPANTDTGWKGLSLCWRCSWSSRAGPSRGGPRNWGKGLVGGRQIPLGALEPQDPRRHA